MSQKPVTVFLPGRVVLDPELWLGSVFRIPFFSLLLHPLSRDEGASAYTHSHLDHCRPISSNLGPMAFLRMNSFYWHWYSGAQKPAFEKLPSNNGAIHLPHKHESFSVCSSDRIPDNERRLPAPTGNVWEFLSYIYESLNCGFLDFSEICPSKKAMCASQLYIYK